MFVNLRTEILVNCLHRRVRVPTTMVNCMMEARDLETAQEAPSSSLADIIVEACAVLASITEDTINMESPSRHISRLLSVDEDLKRWSQKISTAHGYTTRISHDTDDIAVRE
ncbi:hypothetical protein AbraIFM66950_005223 [Aspergillus brasiliensis]|nr:hypothetical protein AbraIFM66950_005223 [Aspergillus brasiliensis]